MQIVELPPVHPGRSVPPPSTPRWLPWVIGGQAVVIVGLIAGGLWWLHGASDRPAPAPPSPVADYDPAFVPIGKQLRERFARDFAAGYEDGTKVFEAGQTRQQMIETGKTAIGDGRVKSFEEVAAPALNKIIDPEKAEDKITPEERRAFVRARRGITKGAMP